MFVISAYVRLRMNIKCCYMHFSASAAAVLSRAQPLWNGKSKSNVNDQLHHKKV